MKFEIEHERDIIGNQIRVVVSTEGDQRISCVSTEVDNFPAGNDPLIPPARQYRRTWRKQGQAGPGREHTVRVTATGQDGNQESAVEQWQDAS